MMNKSRGISLLETLLALAIGAAIILAAVRYFSITHRSLNVTHAIQQIQSLDKASYEWLSAQKQENFGDTDGGEKVSMQALTDAGLVEDKDSATKDPWGKDISITPGSDAENVKITLPNVPAKSCKNLSRRLENISKSKKPSCNSNRNDYTGEF
jgi:type II secretory pathway pseudopilin PulG